MTADKFQVAQICRRRGRLRGAVAGLVALVGVILNASAAGLSWDSQTIQLPAEFGQKEVKARFHFRNAGTVPIAIVSIHTDCGCTTAELEKKNYGAGEDGTIDVTFAVGERSGVNERTITVTTDEADAKPVQLRLNVDIKVLFSIEPRVVRWTVGDKPEPKSIVITSQTPRPMSVIVARSTNPDIGARIETIEAGKKYQVVVEPARTTTSGPFPIELQIDVTGSPLQVIYAFALFK